MAKGYDYEQQKTYKYPRLQKHPCPEWNSNLPTHDFTSFLFNRLTPNDTYMGRTAPLTSKRCILYIYSTNIGAEYF